MRLLLDPTHVLPLLSCYNFVCVRLTAFHKQMIAQLCSFLSVLESLEICVSLEVICKRRVQRTLPRLPAR